MHNFSSFSSSLFYFSFFSLSQFFPFGALYLCTINLLKQNTMKPENIKKVWDYYQQCKMSYLIRYSQHTIATINKNIEGDFSPSLFYDDDQSRVHIIVQQYIKYLLEQETLEKVQEEQALLNAQQKVPNETKKRVQTIATIPILISKLSILNSLRSQFSTPYVSHSYIRGPNIFPFSILNSQLSILHSPCFGELKVLNSPFSIAVCPSVLKKEKTVIG